MKNYNLEENNELLVEKIVEIQKIVFPKKQLKNR
jgi:hypothetical protein